MKMISLKYFTGLLLLFILATSCKKVIDIDLRNQSGELVIEGNFTDVIDTQVVKLSRNVPFTGTNTYPPVTGASVTMDNHHGRITTFTEGPAGFYSVSPLGGIPGRTYTLSVVVDGKTYTADSTMPQVVAMDSITARPSIFDNGKGQKVITVYFRDPPGVANQYRFVLFVNHVQVKDVFAYDDEFVNGKYVSLDLQENDIDIYAGDTVEVEMQCIDKPVYNYWFTLSQQQADNPGGAVAPSNPPTNFTPATLGYFSAHTTASITLAVK
jgi:hypothetical protein